MRGNADETNAHPHRGIPRALRTAAHRRNDAVITVGIIKDGQVSYTVYGENGAVLPAEPHTYEIGSLTKTFTAALINKAIREGELDFDDMIDQYLTLPAGNAYPTIQSLLTHTSGYKAYYFERPMIGNYINGRNAFCGVTDDMVLHKAGTLDMKQDSYGFTYSNFGYAVLGLVLEAVYDTDYTTLLNGFAQNGLGLGSTRISDQSGDLSNYWDWQADDAYLPAGGITSNIEDMLQYAKYQLDGDVRFSNCHKSLKTIHASTESYEAMGVYVDEIGMAWIIDRENGVVWHNGGTGDYNSYLGFSPEIVPRSLCFPIFRRAIASPTPCWG